MLHRTLKRLTLPASAYRPLRALLRPPAPSFAVGVPAAAGTARCRFLCDSAGEHSFAATPTRVYVGGLPLSIKPGEVREEFAKNGHIISDFYMPLDRDTGRGAN